MHNLRSIRSKIPVRDLESRATVERLYVCLELHLRLAQVWIRFAFVPATFGIVTGVLAAAYATVRYVNTLPLYLYIMFPLTAVVLMGNYLWLSHDAVRVVRASEVVLIQTLRNVEAEHLRELSRVEKLKVVKRANASQVLGLPMGNFTTFSLKVPVVIWEEVLNQLILLLSF